MKNEKFIAFLDGIMEYDINGILESIKLGYNIIYESSENVVDSIKSQLGSPEENPLDQVDEQSEIDPNIDPNIDIEQEPELEEPDLNNSI